MRDIEKTIQDLSGVQSEIAQGQNQVDQLIDERDQKPEALHNAYNIAVENLTSRLSELKDGLSETLSEPELLKTVDEKRSELGLTVNGLIDLKERGLLTQEQFEQEFENVVKGDFFKPFITLCTIANELMGSEAPSTYEIIIGTASDETSEESHEIETPAKERKTDGARGEGSVNGEELSDKFEIIELIDDDEMNRLIVNGVVIDERTYKHVRRTISRLTETLSLLEDGADYGRGEVVEAFQQLFPDFEFPVDQYASYLARVEEIIRTVGGTALIERKGTYGRSSKVSPRAGVDVEVIYRNYPTENDDTAPKPGSEAKKKALIPTSTKETEERHIIDLTELEFQETQQADKLAPPTNLEQLIIVRALEVLKNDYRITTIDSSVFDVVLDIEDSYDDLDEARKNIEALFTNLLSTSDQYVKMHCELIESGDECADFLEKLLNVARENNGLITVPNLRLALDAVERNLSDLAQEETQSSHVIAGVDIGELEDSLRGEFTSLLDHFSDLESDRLGLPQAVTIFNFDMFTAIELKDKKIISPDQLKDRVALSAEEVMWVLAAKKIDINKLKLKQVRVKVAEIIDSLMIGLAA